MENILKIRRIIKYYVAFNLSLFGISIVIGLIYNIKNDPNTSETLHAFSKNQMLVSGLVVLVLIAAIVLLVWLFYKLIYGILLKRLNENYNTLKNLEA
jgi:dolichyl-phosphate-mannose--protein O-mannosyl transferase